MTRTDDTPDFGTLFQPAVAMTSLVQAMMSRPSYRSVPQSTLRPGGLGWIGRAVDLVQTWHQRARERRKLMQLSDHMLRDIGITRAMAGGEAEKPFWRV